MKLYIVVTPFFPTHTSFRGSFIYDQVKALEKTGKFKVVVFRPVKSLGADYIYEKMRIYHFHTRETPSYLFNGYFNNYNSKQFLFAVKRLGINIDDVSVVHCHTSTFGIYGLILKKLNSNIKVLLQHHDRDPFTILNGRLSGWRLNMMYRARKNIEIFNNVDYHVCISKMVEDNLLEFPQAGSKENYQPYINRLKLAKRLPQIKLKKSIVLYNGVNLMKFYPIEGYKRHDEFVVGCIGNFQSLKKQIDLIMAAEFINSQGSIPNLKVLLIGSGELLEKCKQYVSQHNLQSIITFKTEIAHENLVDFYNKLDVFVLPSMFEGFGCVCTEAAACGVPFMMCKNQGASEYILSKEVSQWLFDPQSPKEIAQRLEMYFNNRQQQHLAYPINIDVLISEFLKKINE